jgi:hypothetical protein
MESDRAALSLARIAGRAGFAGPTLTAFSPLLAGFFLSFGRIFRNLEQGFHALFKVLLGFLSLVIFVFFWHQHPSAFGLGHLSCAAKRAQQSAHFLGNSGISPLSVSPSALVYPLPFPGLGFLAKS